jgi:hypothetical protein
VVLLWVRHRSIVQVVWECHRKVFGVGRWGWEEAGHRWLLAAAGLPLSGGWGGWLLKPAGAGLPHSVRKEGFGARTSW